MFAHNKKAYTSWRRQMDRQTHKVVALHPAALEQQMSRIAAMFPENVERGTL